MPRKPFFSAAQGSRIRVRMCQRTPSGCTLKDVQPYKDVYACTCMFLENVFSIECTLVAYTKQLYVERQTYTYSRTLPQPPPSRGTSSVFITAGLMIIKLCAGGRGTTKGLEIQGHLVTGALLLELRLGGNTHAPRLWRPTHITQTRKHLNSHISCKIICDLMLYAWEERERERRGREVYACIRIAGQ